jgi:hypothetical protein
MRPTVLPACLLAVVLAACGGASAGEPGVTRVDSAGVEIVSNTGADRPIAWRFERLRAFGGRDDGPESFHGVGAGSVAFDAAGALYILDGANHRVVVFDRDGRHVRTLGRRGGGPGELGRFTLSVTVDQDGTVGVYDMERRGLVRWDANGGVLETIPIPAAVHGTRVALFDGHAYGTIDARTDFTLPPVLELRGFGNGEGRQLAELRQPPTRPIAFRSCALQLSGMPAVFEPTLLWAAHAGIFAIAAGPEYTITIRDGQRATRVLRRDVPPIAPSTAIAARELRDTMRVAFGGGACAIPPEEVAEARGIAAVVQLVKRVALAPDGSVWAERRVFDAHDTRIDVFTPDGAYAGTLPPDAPWPVAFRGADEFAVIERDALDVQHVVIYRIQRGD